MKNSIHSEIFGKLKSGQKVHLFTLKNADGTTIKITNLGGIITSIFTKDKNGSLEDIVLGFDDLNSYINDHAYFGSIVGRYANRIANGQFSIEGGEYFLAKNNGNNNLHGGIEGFHKKLWNAEIFQSEEKFGLQLTYLSADGEEGFPGNLNCQVTYLLTNNNELVIDYECVTDKDTVVNLTNHTYFNLKNGGKTSVEQHLLKLFATQITEVDNQLIPTGNLLAIKNSPFDFFDFKTIGAEIDSENGQLKLGDGYDHNFVIHPQNDELKIAAKVFEPESGRTMEVWTTEPGIQLFTANFFDESIVGKNGVAYPKRAAFCLETQHFPDSPNQNDFPTTLLRKGEIFKSQTIYKFGVEAK